MGKIVFNKDATALKQANTKHYKKRNNLLYVIIALEAVVILGLILKIIIK